MHGIELKAGQRGILSHQVAASDLATNWRNDVPVLATPVLLWLAEISCMRAIEGTLGDEQMTLGYGHDVRHLAATPEGWTIQIEAVLRNIDGKLLTFDVEASDGTDTILSGRHTRALVRKERFLDRLDVKAASKPRPRGRA